MRFIVLVFYISGFLLWTDTVLALPEIDGRDLALGGMVVADIAPSKAMFFNPAALSDSERLETTFTQTRLTVSDFDFAVGLSLPIVPKGLGFGLGWDAVANRNQVLTGIVRDSNGQVILDPNTGQPLTQVLGFFTQSINTFYASCGLKVGFYSIGLSAKYYLTDFGGSEGTGFGLDGAVRADINPNLCWGVLFSDIHNTVVQFNDSTLPQTMPFTWTTSLYWKFAKVGEFTLAVEPQASEGFWDGSALNYGTGLEVGWLKSIFVRCGDTQLNGASFGIGLVSHPTKVFKEIRVDYAYLAQAPDGYPSRLSLSVIW